MVVPWLLNFVLHDESDQAGIAAICEKDKEDHGGQSPTVILARCLKNYEKSFRTAELLVEQSTQAGQLHSIDQLSTAVIFWYTRLFWNMFTQLYRKWSIFLFILDIEGESLSCYRGTPVLRHADKFPGPNEARISQLFIVFAYHRIVLRLVKTSKLYLSHGEFLNTKLPPPWS